MDGLASLPSSLPVYNIAAKQGTTMVLLESRLLIVYFFSLLRAICPSKQAMQDPSKQRLCCVNVSPSGRYMAIGGDDETIKVIWLPGMTPRPTDSVDGRGSEVALTFKTPPKGCQVLAHYSHEA